MNTSAVLCIIIKRRMISYLPKNVKKNRKIVVDNEKSFVI